MNLLSAKKALTAAALVALPGTAMASGNDEVILEDHNDAPETTTCHIERNVLSINIANGVFAGQSLVVNLQPENGKRLVMLNDEHVLSMHANENERLQASVPEAGVSDAFNADLTNTDGKYALFISDPSYRKNMQVEFQSSSGKGTAIDGITFSTTYSSKDRRGKTRYDFVQGRAVTSCTGEKGQLQFIQ
ncbi:MAG: hypothetical protein H6854_05285 [Rhodospirillales bacterium]|nr:hypothetical protein [Rhodospirillales bacterium]MCB9973954.1 hypothetical protein [Rhodospirillales bacterium]